MAFRVSRICVKCDFFALLNINTAMLISSDTLSHLKNQFNLKVTIKNRFSKKTLKNEYKA